jgi:hypothetical protein
MRHGWFSALSVTVALACLAGCGHKSRGGDRGALPAPSAAAPVDHLAPGELPEGSEKAFALVLPRDTRVESRFQNEVIAWTPAKSDTVANFIRGRVRDGTATPGAGGTVFDNVHVPAEPQRILHVRVERGPVGTGCRVYVRDISPTPEQKFPSEAARWKAVGLSPDGKLLDPKHLE